MQVLSYVPGRVRFKVDELYRNSEVARVIRYYLRGMNGVKDCCVNSLTGSLTVIFDPEVIEIESLRKEVMLIHQSGSRVLEDWQEELDEIYTYEAKVDTAKLQMGLYGSLYVLFKLKHWVFGKFAPGNSLMVLEIAALLTILGAYPPLKRFLAEVEENTDLESAVQAASIAPACLSEEDSPEGIACPADVSRDVSSAEKYNNLLLVAGVALTLIREGSKGMLLLFLKACTDYLQARSTLEMKAALLHTPSSLTLVRTVEETEERYQLLKRLHVGECIRYRVDEPVLVDGVILRGNAELNCTYYGGHAGMRAVGAGDRVNAGEMVVEGEIDVEVQQLPAWNAKTSQGIEALQIWKQMRRYQEYALYLALPLAFTGYLLTGSLVTALAVLLVMNPNSQELALSSSLTHYVKHLQSKKIFLRNLPGLEAIADVNWVVFDKTGTLTDVQVKGLENGDHALYEELHPGAEKALQELRELGINEITILSGDEDAKVEQVAKILQVQDYHSKLTPEEKAQWIEANREEKGPVLMVGDGVNDTLAMKVADVSIAYGECGHAQLQADCLILEQRLDLIPELIALTRQGYRQMQQNLIFSQLYDLGAALVSMPGYLDLFQAESIHVLNSICSVWSGTTISLRKVDDLHNLWDFIRHEKRLSQSPELSAQLNKFIGI